MSVRPFAPACGAISPAAAVTTSSIGNVGNVVVHRSGLELRVVQHLVDEPEQVLLARVNAAQVLPLLRRSPAREGRAP